MSTQRSAHRFSRRLVASAVLALLTASCWWAWMAWDRSYQTDPVTGTASGPYQPWQVIGCVACLVVLAAAAAVRLPARLVVLIMPVAFAVAWSWTASSSDDSGLWVVGALLVFVGMLVGTGVISRLTTAVHPNRTPVTPR